jgi:hypothetical protein
MESAGGVDGDWATAGAALAITPDNKVTHRRRNIITSIDLRYSVAHANHQEHNISSELGPIIEVPARAHL